jgi:HEAT repeat protein
LAKIGTIADRQEIVKSVNSADSERAHAAIVAIGEARMPEGVAPLATFLKSDAPPTLRKAATLSLESLAEARVAGAFATLRTLIASDEPPVRIEAAETLGRLKSIYAEASEILKEIQTKDPSPEVRVAAKLALEPRP